MDKNLVPQIFNHEEFGQLRIVRINDVPWAVVADVGKILDLTNIRKNLADFPDDEKRMFDILTTVTNSYTTPRQVTQAVWCVNEAGLYRLIFMSRKPEAEKFKRWVFHEVLPSIRKTGEYKANNEKPDGTMNFRIYEGTGEGDFGKIPRLEINGELVLTTVQLAKFFDCSAQSIVKTFNRHKEKFVEGKHYFKLVGENLRDFKRIMTDYNSGTNCHSETNCLSVMVSANATSFYLWTVLGVSRFAKSLTTKNAWAIYEKLAINYFSDKKVSVKQPEGKIPKNELTDEKKIKFLLQAAKITKDAVTRENLISMATALINGNK